MCANSASDLVFLVSALLNNKQPDSVRVKSIDLKALYAFAEAHTLRGITAFALEHAGIHDKAFTEAKGLAIRKVIILSMEREKVINELEKAKIWYMPLKGSILKDYYPALGMRESADCDILIDPSRADDVKAIMKTLGFKVEDFGMFDHDVYFKPPVSNFEMHRKLIGDSKHEKLYSYYYDTKSRLIKDNDNNYGYHFSTEDFYVYMTAHEFKHYSSGGTGLRSLLDVYVYVRKFYASLDKDYLARELENAGLTEFEEKNRMLAMRLFDGQELNDEEREMLNYILSSGTYGTIEHEVKNKLRENQHGKVKYILSRIFLPMSEVKDKYPFFWTHKYLLPLLPVHRVIRAVRKSKKTIAELRTVMKQ